MAECLFEKVFDGLKLSANVKTVLKNTLVDNLSISTKGRKMIVDLSSDIFIDENCICRCYWRRWFVFIYLNSIFCKMPRAENL